MFGECDYCTKSYAPKAYNWPPRVVRSPGRDLKMVSREVLIQIAKGRLNKQIADEMGITESKVGPSQQHDVEDQGRVGRGTLWDRGQAEAAA